MAKGFSACHPVTRFALESLGVRDSQVLQAWGDAPPSAGFHTPEGQYAGKPYSSCVDLSWDLVSPNLFHHMAAAGFAAFVRDWRGNQHIHAVHVGLKDDNGQCRVLPGPRAQIIDWTHGLNGLRNHARLSMPYAPTPDERNEMMRQYAAWVADFATAVIAPEGRTIWCSAFLEGDDVTCDVDAFLAWWGFGWDGATRSINGHGHSYTLRPDVPVYLTGGQWHRGPIRPFFEAIGLKGQFEWAPNRAFCVVRLEY